MNKRKISFRKSLSYMSYKAKYTANAISIIPTNNKLNLISLAKFFFKQRITNISPSIKDRLIIPNPIVTPLSLIYFHNFTITKSKYIFVQCSNFFIMRHCQNCFTFIFYLFKQPYDSFSVFFI